MTSLVNINISKYARIDDQFVTRSISNGRHILHFVKEQVVIQQTPLRAPAGSYYIFRWTWSKRDCISIIWHLSLCQMDDKSYLLFKNISFLKSVFFDSARIARFGRYFCIYCKDIDKSLIQCTFSLQSAILGFDLFKRPVFLQKYKWKDFLSNNENFLQSFMVFYQRNNGFGIFDDEILVEQKV